jgi:hypothetical protein
MILKLLSSINSTLSKRMKTADSRIISTLDPIYKENSIKTNVRLNYFLKSGVAFKKNGW